MNVHESEKLAGILRSRGFSECEDFADADILVLNTRNCGDQSLRSFGKDKEPKETRCCFDSMRLHDATKRRSGTACKTLSVC